MLNLRRSAALAVTIVLLSAGGLACSSDSSSASTCDDLQTLAGQVSDFSVSDVIKTGSDGVEDQIDEIDATLDDLKTSGSDQFGDDVDALKSSISDLGAAITDSESLSEASGNIKAAVEGISDAWTQLVDTARDEFSDCDLTVSDD